jgi:hypothetical protein
MPDAFRTGEPVGERDLQAGAGSWPSFSEAALHASDRRSHCQYGCGRVTLGALNLLRSTSEPMMDFDLIIARAFADLAALSISQHRASTELSSSTSSYQLRFPAR